MWKSACTLFSLCDHGVNFRLVGRVKVLVRLGVVRLVRVQCFLACHLLAQFVVARDAQVRARVFVGAYDWTSDSRFAAVALSYATNVPRCALVFLRGRGQKDWRAHDGGKRPRGLRYS